MITEKDIKDILQPHLGRLELFKKLSKTTNIKKLKELNSLLKNYKTLIKNENFDVDSYDDYYQLVGDLFKLIHIQNLHKYFKEKLTSPTKNFIKELLQNNDYVEKLTIIKESDFISKQFFRRSSLIKSKKEFINYINTLYQINVTKILIDYFNEDLINHENLFFLKMTEDKVHLCPECWCLKEHHHYVRETEHHNIYLMYNEDTGKFYGLSLSKNRKKDDFIMSEYNEKLKDPFKLDYRKILGIKEIIKTVKKVKKVNPNPVEEEEAFDISREEIERHLTDILREENEQRQDRLRRWRNYDDLRYNRDVEI